MPQNTFRLIEDFDRDTRPESAYEPDSVNEFVMREKTLKAIERLYRHFDFTVRDICFAYEIEYKPEYQKLFFKLFGAKGKGHGGARRNSSKLYQNHK